MHSVKLTVIANQEIEINGLAVNIHDLRSIELDGCGRIVGYWKNDEPLYETRSLLARDRPLLEIPLGDPTPSLFGRPVIESDDLVTSPVIEAGSMIIGDTEGLHILLDGNGQRIYDGKRRIWP